MKYLWAFVAFWLLCFAILYFIRGDSIAGRQFMIAEMCALILAKQYKAEDGE